jgi:hypothetical protein
MNAPDPGELFLNYPLTDTFLLPGLFEEVFPAKLLEYSLFVAGLIGRLF